MAMAPALASVSSALGCRRRLPLPGITRVAPLSLS